MQLREQQLVQPLPHAGLLPRAQSPPGGHPTTKAELLRQMLPTDPRAQYEQDPLQREPVIKRLPTRIAKTTLPPRQQRLDPLPKRIRDLPRLRPHRHPPPKLTTGADGLRYQRTGPFIQLELLRAKPRRGSAETSAARAGGRPARLPSAPFELASDRERSARPTPGRAVSPGNRRRSALARIVTAAEDEEPRRIIPHAQIEIEGPVMADGLMVWLGSRRRARRGLFRRPGRSLACGRAAQVSTAGG